MSIKHGLARRFYTGQISYNPVGRKRFWYAFSAVVLAACFLTVGFRDLTLNIDFQGGTNFQVVMPVTETTVDGAHAKVADFEVKDLRVQVFSLRESTVWIQTRSLDSEETISARAAIAKLADVKPDDVTYTAIGASWDEQTSRQALIVLGMLIALMMVLIGFWFHNWKTLLAATITLVHDLVITIGIYALSGFTVTSAIVTGALTILGYSFYDATVIFDQMSENIGNLKESRKAYGKTANLAINRVPIRSLNTTLIRILPVMALLIGGVMFRSGPLVDLNLALLIDMVTSAYSSIFIVTPLLVQAGERRPVQVIHRASLARKAGRAAAKIKREPSGENAGDGEENTSSSGVVASSEMRKQRGNLSREQKKR